MHNFPHDARADESLIDYDSPHAAHRDEVSQASYDKDVELEATGAKRPSWFERLKRAFSARF